MIITKLYTGEDGKSHFEDIDCGHETQQPLGWYSKKFPASGIMFRDFEPGLVYEMHNAPQPQYIIYLEGEVEVTTSGGETRRFKPGDVLFAADLTGEGHVSKMLTKGRSVIVTTK
jgi:uncharacterized cupin superfamily protein